MEWLKDATTTINTTADENAIQINGEDGNRDDLLIESTYENDTSLAACLSNGVKSLRPNARAGQTFPLHSISNNNNNPKGKCAVRPQLQTHAHAHAHAQVQGQVQVQPHGADLSVSRAIGKKQKQQGAAAARDRHQLCCQNSPCNCANPKKAVAIMFQLYRPRVPCFLNFVLFFFKKKKKKEWMKPFVAIQSNIVDWNNANFCTMF
ncbi:hypothetical protein RFI_33130, partial [Reticulomyxa filosa]